MHGSQHQNPGNPPVSVPEKLQQRQALVKMEVEKLIMEPSKVHSAAARSPISTAQRAGMAGSDSYNAAHPTTVQAHLDDEGPPQSMPPPGKITIPVSFRSACEESQFYECKDVLECVMKHKPYRAGHTKKAGAWQAALEELQAQKPIRCVGRSSKWLRKRVKDLIEFVEKGEFHKMVNAAPGNDKRKFNLTAVSMRCLGDCLDWLVTDIKNCAIEKGKDPVKRKRAEQEAAIDCEAIRRADMEGMATRASRNAVLADITDSRSLPSDQTGNTASRKRARVQRVMTCVGEVHVRDAGTPEMTGAGAAPHSVEAPELAQTAEPQTRPSQPRPRITAQGLEDFFLRIPKPWEEQRHDVMMELVVAIQQQTAVLKWIANEMGEVKQMVQMLLEP